MWKFINNVGEGEHTHGRAKAYGAEVWAQDLKNCIKPREPQMVGENTGALCLLPAMSPLEDPSPLIVSAQ